MNLDPGLQFSGTMHLLSFWGDSKCSLGSVCHVHKICSRGSGPPTFRPFLHLPTGRGSMAQMAVRGNFVFMHFEFTLYAFCNFHFCIVANLYFCILYIIPFLTFKAAGRGPKVAARGGKCLLRSRNVAGIEILQGFSSMKWCKMFFYSNVA